MQLLGLAVGVVGLAYGLWRDAQLRAIQSRTAAPHFVPVAVCCKWKVATITNNKTNITYPDMPWGISEIMRPPHGESALRDRDKVPSDYPDGRPVGILLRNDGPHLRCFRVGCKEQYHFARDPFTAEHFFLNYMYKQSDFGAPLTFKLWYETENGHQGKQTWELIRGVCKIRRVRPK